MKILKKLLWYLVFLCVTISFAFPIKAQIVQLVKDIAAGAASSDPNNFKLINGIIYFQANDGTNGYEFWKYDGTNPPEMIADIFSGSSGSFAQQFTLLNTKIIFRANNGTNGHELWEYDGSNAPAMIMDINPGVPASAPANIMNLNGLLVFQATTANEGTELWKYDGINPTSLVADIRAGASSSTPDKFYILNNTLFFQANDGTNGIELWKYDGINPPSMISDINSGSPSASPDNFSSIGDTLYFSADNGISGTELWKYDGVNPPAMVADIISGSTSSGPLYLTNVNNIIYFRAAFSSSGVELGKYDGINPPSMVADIIPGVGSSLIDQMTPVNGILYFRVNGDGTNGAELWKYEGVSPPSMVADINPGSNSSNPHSITFLNGKIYFVAGEPTNGTEIWMYDGINPPSNLTNINPAGNSAPLYLTLMNSSILFQANDGTSGTEIWQITPCNVTSSFTASDNQICASDTIQFTNTGTGGLTYSWLLDGVAFSSAQDTLLEFSTPGLYSVGLAVADTNSCADTTLVSIQVDSLPDAGSDMDYCLADGIFTLPLATPAGGTWSGLGITNATTGEVDPTGLSGPKTYTYTHTGCPDQMVVTYTPVLGTPIVGCGISTSTSITWTWPALSVATDYEVNFGFGWIPPSGINSHTETGKNPGEKMTIQVRAIRSGACAEVSPASTLLECEATAACIPFNIVMLSDTLFDVTVCPGANAMVGLFSILRPDGLGKFIWTWSGDSVLIDNKPGPFTVNTSVTKTYYVTVTDTSQLACPSVTDSTVVTVYNMSASVTQNNVSCFGGNDGSAKVTVTGAPGPFTYNWTPDNESIDSVINKIQGTYSCVIKMVNDPKCQITKSVTITEPTQLLTDAGLDDSVKCGSLVNLDGVASGGTSPYTFNWSNGTPGQFNNNVSFGNYTLSVTDSKGCVATDNVDVKDVPTTLTVANVKEVVCNGQTATGSVIVTGGTSPFSYQWDSGDIIPFITKPAGVYFVTVRDAENCIRTGVFTVKEMAPLVISAGSDQFIQCANLAATITGVIYSGTAPITLKWDSNGVLNSSVTGLVYSNATVGVYTLTVIDSLECTVSDQAEVIKQASTLTLSTLSTKATCQTCTDGIASVTTAEGTSPYSYLWSSVPPQTGATATGLASGDYTVTVTDANGCVQTAEVFVDFITGNTSDVLFSENIFIYPNPVTQNLTIEIMNPGKKEVKLSLYNLLGQMVTQKLFPEGVEKITAVLEHTIFSKEVYVLKTIIGEKENYYRIVVVK